MEIRFDSANTTWCPSKGISTREECYDCIYFKTRFRDALGGKVFVMECWGKELEPTEKDLERVFVK